MKKFEKKLHKMLENEKQVLPESLSAENIEKLINEKGAIASPKRAKVVSINKHLRRFAYAAAIVVVAVVGVLTFDSANEMVSDHKQEQVIKESVASSDYSEIENIILDYYRSFYNNANDDDFDLFSDMFGAKEESAEMAVNGGTAATSTQGVVAADITDGGDTFSETNTQVEGVDEADIMKNDGRYIYMINGNYLTVTDASKPEKLQTTADIELFESSEDFAAREMFLYKDKLVVLLEKSRELYGIATENEDSTVKKGDNVFVVADSFYPYYNIFETCVKIYDISDKSSVEMITDFSVSGSYISARITDGKLILVSLDGIPYGSLYGFDFEDGCKVLKENCIPEYNLNGEKIRLEPDRINMLDKDAPDSYTVCTVMSLDGDEHKPQVSAMLCGATEIYCSDNELFLAESVSTYWVYGKDYIITDINNNGFYTATRIYKFDITATDVVYNNTAIVGGCWLNQFSMDEYDGYFRIVTCGMKYGDYTTETMVYVLDENMNLAGYLEGIAPGEDMKSARFMGKTLYLVTFMQTDPLFVIDLTDPTKPVVNGELVIPGFSTYMHPVGNGLVIGTGAGGTLNGTDGSAKISLFDVSDPFNPQELDNYSVPEASFMNNHKAFTVIDENTFGITLCDYKTGAKIVVFSIESNSIIIEGIYECLTTAAYEMETARCASIGNTLFAVCSKGIKSYDVETGGELDTIIFRIERASQ